MKNIHKDFHGAFSNALDYLKDNFGREVMESYLKRMAKNVYSPLIKKLKKKGLKVLEEHWREIFDLENGKCTISYRNSKLILLVKECPAISHMLKKEYKLSDSFCESTRIVNETICKEAGYKCSLKLGPKKGTCEQRFWKLDCHALNQKQFRARNDNYFREK